MHMYPNMTEQRCVNGIKKTKQYYLIKGRLLPNHVGPMAATIPLVLSLLHCNIILCNLHFYIIISYTTCLYLYFICIIFLYYML